MGRRRAARRLRILVRSVCVRGFMRLRGGGHSYFSDVEALLRRRELRISVSSYSRSPDVELHLKYGIAAAGLREQRANRSWVSHYGEFRAAYNKAQRLPERRILMQAWAD